MEWCRLPLTLKSLLPIEDLWIITCYRYPGPNWNTRDCTLHTLFWNASLFSWRFTLFKKKDYHNTQIIIPKPNSSCQISLRSYDWEHSSSSFHIWSQGQNHSSERLSSEYYCWDALSCFFCDAAHYFSRTLSFLSMQEVIEVLCFWFINQNRLS